MLTAEYGGTGGRAIEQFMVVEEPDIEIGAGVSSKGMFSSFFLPLTLPTHLPYTIDSFSSFPSVAMSRRIATDQGGKRGPQSSRVDNTSEHNDDRNNRNRPTSSQNDSQRNNAMPPNMNGFPANFAAAFPNGMPGLPPGFPMMFPTQQGGNR